MKAEELVQRATAGKRLDKKVHFKASNAWAVLKDPYRIWCDLHAPPSEAIEESTRYDRLKFEWGCEFEKRWVYERYPSAVEIVPRWGPLALEATARAMCSGAPAIYQPQLWSLGDGVYGLGDLIVREDGASDLGAWRYRVIEIKRSKELRPYAAAQATFYNRVLSRLQGVRPSSVDVVLKGGVTTVPADAFEPVCNDILREWDWLRWAVDPPELPGWDRAEPPWRIYTNRTLELRRDVSLFRAIPPSMRPKFREAGIRSVDELTPEIVEKVGGEALRRRFESWKSGRPVFASELVVPRRRRALYYDFETCDDNHPAVAPHVYMIGAYDAAADRFHLFTARGPDDEARIFAEFAALVGDPSDVALYHWTKYELGQLEEEATRHPELRDRLAALIGASVDLHRCVKASVCLGTGSYSIKEVAPFLGFNWRQADVGAYESMVLYWEWLKDGDPAKIARVATYNEDDCRAMAHVDAALSRATSRSTA